MSGQKSFKMADFSSVIIGCGRIGTFFDNPDSEYHFTHAKGYYLSDNVELKGVYDINADSAKKAARLWKTESFTDLESMLSTVKPEIVSICVPDEYHYEYLKYVAEFIPRAVIAEKPLTMKYEHSIEIYELYKKKGILCNVNYIRRFDPYLQNLRKEYKKGKLGKLVNGYSIYGKGLLHNGCHIINFLYWLFGEIIDYRILLSRVDNNKNDPTVDLWLQIEEAESFHLLSADESRYTVFEIILFFEKLKVELLRGGIIAFETVPSEDDLFPGYRDLIHRQEKKTLLGQTSKYLIQNTVDSLLDRAELICSVKDALETEKICIDIISSLETKSGSTSN
jgi:predicted dehydrogenase